jgi:hypothetical protein
MPVLTLYPLALRAALVAVMGAAVTSAARSQTASALTPESFGIVPGARARLIVSDYGEDPQTGTVTAVRGDSIVFRRDQAGDSLTIGFAHVGRLDISRGRHARPITGLGLGFLAGAAAGALAGAAAYHKPRCPSANDGFCGFLDFGVGGNAAAGAVLGAAGGALVGLIAGSVIHTDRWRTVSLNGLLDHPQAGIALVPSRSGPRLAVRVAARF